VAQKVAAITALNTELTQHSLTQHEQLEGIQQTAQTSTRHLVQGQKELQEAANHGFMFRTITLFICVVAGCSLLFLDWLQ